LVRGADSEPEVVSSEALSPEDKVLLKLGEDLTLNTLETIRDFAEVAISLVSGLFVTYFAILKFLGADDITKPQVQAIAGMTLWPPILFIFSLLAFVFVVLPFPGKLTLNVPQSIISTWNSARRFKFVATVMGTILLLAGMSMMALISLKLLSG